MKNIFKFLTISLSFLILNIETVQAATAKGNADVYKVTMRKIELCTGYTVVDFDDSLLELFSFERANPILLSWLTRFLKS